ncbi:MAG: Ferredoxin [Crocinitomicaceae bacterium]|nr:MAG: Ferredoxin [Crocinitomicaceae bacterium]
MLYLYKINNHYQMAIKITDECINCGACEPECPNTAIYEGGAEWKFSDGTSLKGNYTGKNSGVQVDATKENEPVEMDVYFIVTDKCTECVGFHDEPQCAAVCPVDCCIPDENFVEERTSLLEKKDSLHIS